MSFHSHKKYELQSPVIFHFCAAPNIFTYCFVLLMVRTLNWGLLVLDILNWHLHELSTLTKN